MRIERVVVENWRQIHHVDISIPKDSNVVCLIGENGAGKSSLLEIVSECLMALGIDQGILPPRGHHLQEPHSVRVMMDFSDQVEEIKELFEHTTLFSQSAGLNTWADWKGMATFVSVRDEANGAFQRSLLLDDLGQEHDALGHFQNLFHTLSDRNFLRHLHLDSERVFERADTSWIHLIESNESEWGPTLERIFAYRSTKDLFQQWQSWLIREEVSAGSRLVGQLAMEEDLAGRTQVVSKCELPAKRYRELVAAALPHPRYFRTDPNRRRILFKARGRDVDFFDLSGGEREICYLLGQIDRFNLENGVVLVDEPELHLHPQMVSNWIMFLQQEMRRGQVWLATHSYEAVEAAGLENTFVLRVDPGTSRSSVNVPADQESNSEELFDLLGVPGLTLHGKTLLIVEGGDGPTERNRFKQLVSDAGRFAVLPQGENKDDVVAATLAYKGLEDYSNKSILVKGITDADYDSYNQESHTLHQDKRVLMLGVHEVENLFLHPETLSAIAMQNGRDDFCWKKSVSVQADQTAGKWVFERANFKRHHEWKQRLTDTEFKSLKRRSSQLNWDQIAGNPEWLDQLRVHDALKTHFLEAKQDFEQLREDATWWKHMLGKQVESAIPKYLDLRSVLALETSTFRVWRERPELIPDEVQAVREFVSSGSKPNHTFLMS